MIRADTEIYVIGKGFVKPETLTPGNQVYALDGLKPVVASVESVTSEFLSTKINVIESGQNTVETSRDTRFLYCNGFGDIVSVPFEQIPVITPNKESPPKKYLPVLSYPALAGRMNCNYKELEYVARMLAYGKDAYDIPSFRSIINRCSGEDAIVLVDMLESWVSESPGIGQFGRVSVKSRTHKLYDRYMLDELCKIAVLAGYTAAVTEFTKFSFGLKINYESMPVPGSVPKNQKYLKRHYTGLMYNVNVGNMPTLGRSKNRVFYLPTASVLNIEER